MVKLQDNGLNFKNNMQKDKIICLVKYYNLLTQLLMKYQILQFNLNKNIKTN